MKEVAWVLAFVAHWRGFGRSQQGKLVQSVALEDPEDGGFGDGQRPET